MVRMHDRTCNMTFTLLWYICSNSAA